MLRPLCFQGQDHLPESQVYNWGIKKDASLDDGSHGQKAASSPVSSDALNNSISENALGVNGENVSALAAEKADIEGYRSPFAQLKKKRAVLQQAIDSMDTRPMNPRVYNELNAYSRQLQHLDTMQMLLDQKKSTQQQQQKLQKAQQSPALQKVIAQHRTSTNDTDPNWNILGNRLALRLRTIMYMIRKQEASCN